MKNIKCPYCDEPILVSDESRKFVNCPSCAYRINLLNVLNDPAEETASQSEPRKFYVPKTQYQSNDSNLESERTISKEEKRIYRDILFNLNKASLFLLIFYVIYHIIFISSALTYLVLAFTSGLITTIEVFFLFLLGALGFGLTYFIVYMIHFILKTALESNITHIEVAHNVTR